MDHPLRVREEELYSALRHCADFLGVDGLWLLAEDANRPLAALRGAGAPPVRREQGQWRCLDCRSKFGATIPATHACPKGSSKHVRRLASQWIRPALWMLFASKNELPEDSISCGATHLTLALESSHRIGSLAAKCQELNDRFMQLMELSEALVKAPGGVEQGSDPWIGLRITASALAQGAKEVLGAERAWCGVALPGDFVWVPEDAMQDNSFPVAGIVEARVKDVLASGQVSVIDVDRIDATKKLAESPPGGENWQQVLLIPLLEQEEQRALLVAVFQRAVLGSLHGQFAQMMSALGSAVLDRAYQLAHRDEELRAREERARNLVHEIRKPLSRIQWLVEHGQLGLRPWDEVGRDILKQVRFGEELCGSLPTQPKENPSVRPPHQELNLRDLVYDAFVMFKPEADEKQIKLQIGAFPEELKINGNRGELLAAISALIDNCLRHAGERGTVEVIARHEGERALLEVLDMGPGVPQRFVDALEAGGIGIAMVRRILRNHQGKLHASDGSPGKLAATFTIELPLSTHEEGG